MTPVQLNPESLHAPGWSTAYLIWQNLFLAAVGILLLVFFSKRNDAGRSRAWGLALGLLSAMFVWTVSTQRAYGQTEPSLQFRIVATDEDENGNFAILNPPSGPKLKVFSEPFLDSSAIRNATVVTNEAQNKKEILIEFTRGGAKKFAEMTEAAIGKQLAIIYRGKVISMPRIHSRIPGGKAAISGNFSDKEMNDIVKAILSDVAKSNPPGLIDANQSSGNDSGSPDQNSSRERRVEALVEELRNLEKKSWEIEEELHHPRHQLGYEQLNTAHYSALQSALNEAKLAKVKLDIILSSIKKMKGRSLRTFLQANYPNAVLDSLLTSESKAKLEAAANKELLGSEEKSKRLISQIEQQIEEQVNDIIEGLKWQVEEKELTIEKLEQAIQREQSIDRERQSIRSYLRRKERELNNLQKIIEAINNRLLEEQLDAVEEKLGRPRKEENKSSRSSP